MVIGTDSEMKDRVHFLIEGDELTPRELVLGVQLPSEISTPLPNEAGTDTGTDTASTLNTLNVFDDGLTVGDTGLMSTISSQEFSALGAIFTY